MAEKLRESTERLNSVASQRGLRGKGFFMTDILFGGDGVFSVLMQPHYGRPEERPSTLDLLPYF